MSQSEILFNGQTTRQLFESLKHSAENHAENGVPNNVVREKSAEGIWHGYKDKFEIQTIELGKHTTEYPEPVGLKSKVIYSIPFTGSPSLLHCRISGEGSMDVLAPFRVSRLEYNKIEFEYKTEGESIKNKYDNTFISELKALGIKVDRINSEVEKGNFNNRIADAFKRMINRRKDIL